MFITFVAGEKILIEKSYLFRYTLNEHFKWIDYGTSRNKDITLYSIAGGVTIGLIMVFHARFRNRLTANQIIEILGQNHYNNVIIKKKEEELIKKIPKEARLNVVYLKVNNGTKLENVVI